MLTLHSLGSASSRVRLGPVGTRNQRAGEQEPAGWGGRVGEGRGGRSEEAGVHHRKDREPSSGFTVGRGDRLGLVFRRFSWQGCEGW